ncbi:MAG: hypothetical protein E6Q97_37110 [Desulfurellales bacterium]|nr:MAG: hypothetical protein E6Q97_37110 [Desulfurellales bacterium]
MALQRVYYPAAIQLPSPEITHISDMAPSRNYQVVVERTAGSPTPCFVGVETADPDLSFTTRQLKTVLDVCTSKYICRDLSAGTVDIWYRAGKAMDIREAPTTAVHLVGRLTQSAMLCWSSLRVATGSTADMSARIVTARRASVVDPMIWLGSQQLPTLSGCNRIYGMGPVRLNGNLLEGVTGWTLGINPTMEPIRSDGAKTNTYQGIREYHPVVTLNSNNAAEIADSSFGGDSFNTLELFLQHMTSTNMFNAVDSGTHIKITVYGGLKTVDGITGAVAATSPMFHSVGDDPILIDTSASIV